MGFCEHYQIGNFSVEITPQSLRPDSDELYGFKLTVLYMPSAQTWKAGPFDMLEEVYKRALQIMQDYTDNKDLL